jgi:hypothetical protein
MKIDRGGQGVHHIPKDGTALNDAQFCMALLCILCKYAKDQTLAFDQDDFDSIHGMFLAEGYDLTTGNFLIKLMTRTEAGVADN